MFDGDLLFTTTNQPMMRNQTNLPALRCLQRKAAKKTITEEALIQSNLDGFGSKIGEITNHCAAITSIMTNYLVDSEQYKILKYRTQCFQHGQQNEIDKAKGIVTEPLPKSWWVPSENKICKEDSEEEIAKKTLYAELCADKKPYFFGYVYSSKKREYDKYVSIAESNSMALYHKTIDEMCEQYRAGLLKDDTEIKFVENYLYKLPLDMSESTMNRICWAVEREFKDKDMFRDVDFDYTKLKSGVEYDQKTYETVKYIVKKYKPNTSLAKKRAVLSASCGDTAGDWTDLDNILDKIIEEITIECSDIERLCDILLDLCYREHVYKQLLWAACGNVIFNRLLKAHGNVLSYPKKDMEGEFCCRGVRYSMREIVVKEGEPDENSI